MVDAISSSKSGMLRSTAMGGLGLLVFLGGGTLLMGNLPARGRLPATIFGFVVASLIVGLWSRKKPWSYATTWLAIFGLGFCFFIASSQLLLRTEESDGLTKQEAWLKDCLGVYQQAGDVLASVEDQDTARIATSKIRSLTQQLEALAERTKERINISKEMRDALMAKYMPEMAKQASRVVDLSQSSVNKARGDRAFEDAMDQFQKAYLKLRNS